MNYTVANKKYFLMSGGFVLVQGFFCWRFFPPFFFL